jgi:hypothetical protein
MEDSILKDAVREPISDFVELIKKEKESGTTPTKFVLNFRDWQINNREVNVFKIRTEHLRFRKDNGRISSDVETYERQEEPLQEASLVGQIKLREFLWNKNPDRIKQLMSLLKHAGQHEPAIITCDGFLVNGNRRKLALEKLYEKEKDEKYLWMKVVILPENATIKEIEQIENRYQYHSDGKEEYTNFDKALSIRRKEKSGITLEMQLLDDPEYFNLSPRHRKQMLKKIQTEYLGTLDCIDAYLESLGRQGVYRSVAEGPGDPDGRWEAFMTFNKSVFSKLKDPKERTCMNVKENEVGKVIDSAFKIIRKKDLKTGRLNDVMRKYPQMLINENAKKTVLKLAENPMDLTNDEILRNGEFVEEKEQDRIWSGKYGTEIIRTVKIAKELVESQEDKEKPLDILKAALKKLEHDQLDLESIDNFEIETAMEIVEQIQAAAEDIYARLDKMRYQRKRLEKGFKL